MQTMQHSAKQVTSARANVTRHARPGLYSFLAVAVRQTWGKEAQDHRVVFFSATPNNETLFDILRW